MTTGGGDSSALLIRKWAVVAFVAHATLTCFSYGLAPFAPLLERIPERLEFLASLVARIPGASALGLGDFVAGRGILEHDVVRILAYLVPIAFATLAALAVLRRVLDAKTVVDHKVLATLQKAALAFAAVNIPRFPIFTSDFWISIVWGRMVVEGVNPYYHNFTPAALEGVPLPYFAEHATYGPLWITISGAIALISGKSVIAAWMINKFVLASAWVGMVVVVRRAAERRSPRAAAVALCTVGWLPASVGLAVGEGHNDALLALGVALLMWLGMSRRIVATSLAFTASVLAKYVALPLAAPMLLSLRFEDRQERRRVALAMLLCAGLTTLCFAPYWEGPEMFAAATGMREWQFLSPATALGYVMRAAGLPMPQRVLDALVLLVLLSVAGLAQWRYKRSVNDRTLATAALAIMSVVVFSLVGHVWPWFCLWLLPLAALTDGGWQARWVVALVTMLPVLSLAWILRPDWSLFEPLGLAVFGTSAVLASIPFKRALTS